MQFTEVYVIAISLIIGFIIKYIYDFYKNVQKYPSGPFPLPLFGNLLLFIKMRHQNPAITMQEIGKKYDKLFTFWFGSTPMIIIVDLNLAKEVFNKAEFSGRPNTSLDLIVSGNGIQSYIFRSYSPEIVTLRRLSFEAIRNLLNGERFFSLINEVSIKAVEIMKQRETNKKFTPRKYLERIFLKILAEFSFGQKYEFDDPELTLYSDGFHVFESELQKLILTDYFPLAKYFLKSDKHFKQEMSKLRNIYERNFKRVQTLYKDGSRDNFCEALLTARNKIIDDEKDSSKYMSDSNLIGVITLLFQAGSDSSINNFDWMLLLMCFYPDVQTKLRKEISDKLGDKVAEMPDRQHLHYLHAFICETLRFRNVAPMGLFHTAMIETKIGENLIPKGTQVWVHQYAILNNPEYWSEPEKFLPERFLDSNQMFITQRFAAFIPFSTGKRMCVGERMAADMSFLFLSRLLQLTNFYRFVLADEKQTVNLNPTKTDLGLRAEPYEIYLMPG